MFKNENTTSGLTVLYDSACGFCVSCRQWMESQPSFVPLRFLPARGALARKTFPELAGPEWRDDLIVVSDEGGVYPGADGWLLCLWALEAYREWSLRLAKPALRPLARQAFDLLSRNRKAVSSSLGLLPERDLVERLQAVGPAACGIPATRISS